MDLLSAAAITPAIWRRATDWLKRLAGGFFVVFYQVVDKILRWLNLHADALGLLTWTLRCRDVQ